MAKLTDTQLIVLSAKTETALEQMTKNLAEHLANHPEIVLADVAHTLQVGRKVFDYRRIAVCNDREDAVEVLTGKDQTRLITSGKSSQSSHKIPVGFMFPGVGDHYAGMARELCHHEKPE